MAATACFPFSTTVTVVPSLRQQPHGKFPVDGVVFREQNADVAGALRAGNAA